jgi:hypothetical protein
MPFEKLFEPITISGRTVKNRLVFPPCVVNFGSLDGEVTDTAVGYYEARASGGAGIVIVEAAYVTASGKITPRELGIHEDRLIPGLRRLATAIKRHGALAVLQINHCGRQGRSKVIGEQTVSSSAVPSPTVTETPRAPSYSKRRASTCCTSQPATTKPATSLRRSPRCRAATSSTSRRRSSRRWACRWSQWARSPTRSSPRASSPPARPT